MSDVMKGRALKVYSGVPDGVDAIVLVNGAEPFLDPSFFYLTGAVSGLFEGCAVIIWPDGSREVIASRLEETSARRLDVGIKIFDRNEEREQLLRESLRGVERLGFNAPGILTKDFRELERLLHGVEMVDVGKAIESSRMIKDEGEIENLREACSIASRVAEQIPDFLREGMREYEAAAEISYRMQRIGATGPSFATIAAFGKNSAEPHHSPDDTALVRGETALLDFGAVYRRYCSDITRTFFAGEISPEQERMYEVVREALGLAVDEIRAGVTASEADAKARGHIDSSEFRGRLIHSMGHGLGLSVHEGARLAPNTDLVLEKNMVFTVEPGVYLPGKGGVRIEEVVRVTGDGCEVLTFAPTEMTVI